MDTPADSLMARLMATFAGEADERIQAMNRDVLRLEGMTDADATGVLLERLLREAHSLKGAARAVEVQPVETLAHRLETLFEMLRTGALEAEPAVCDVVLRALDAIGALAREATAGEPAGVDMAVLAGMLDDPRRGVVAAAPPPVEPAATAAMPVPAEPPPPSPQPAPLRPAITASLPHAAAETVRVSVAKLDALVTAVGELVVAHSSTEQRLADLRALASELEAWEGRWRKHRRRTRGGRGRITGDTTADPAASEEYWQRLCDARARVVVLHRELRSGARRITQLTADLDDEVRRSRMLPLATILDAVPRMVRDLARNEGKEVTVLVEGEDTDIDRWLLEELRAPLTHVVRNSIDHGIETPDERERAGKARQGTITIRAEQQGGSLLLEIADDGAGIDLAAIRRRAVEHALITGDEAGTLTDRDALGIIFRPGFSTAPVITDLSGRGVGLDVVRETVERLHGVLDVDTQLGSGSRFSLRLPLSVATTACLLLSASGHVLALPVTNVSHIVRVEQGTLEHVEGRPVVRDESGLMPLTRLADVLGIADGAPPAGGESRPAIVLGSGEDRTAFLVDALLGLDDVVTKTLPPPFVRVRHLSGATILGTGEIVPILNAPDLVRTASPMHDEHESPRAPAARNVVLVAEDSPTTRTLQKSMLEKAGYEVRAVGDGAQAWTVVSEGGIDAVVSDVRMPGMDGFELAERIRASARLRHTPIILVTSTDTPSSRARAAEVGASAFVVKGTAQQQHLVETVQRILGPR